MTISGVQWLCLPVLGSAQLVNERLLEGG